MKFTFEEAIDNHRKMWNWIADETEKRKRVVTKYEYFAENDHTFCPTSCCFCCEYDERVRTTQPKGTNLCKHCPIQWDGDNSEKGYVFCESNDGSSYISWAKYASAFAESVITSSNAEEAARLARKIANLPAREKKEGDL